MDVNLENEFSARLISLYHQYKYFMSSNKQTNDQFSVCTAILNDLDLVLDKGTFTGADLISLLETLIASDVLSDEPKTKDDRYFQLCNDQLKDLLYMSFKEVIV